MSDKIDAAPEKPLVTFAVLAYNQEKYIRDAVKGALEQTYSPLEIILSDDGSKDATFSIMEEMAKSYSGPHTIRLNRNDPNRGLCAHVNKIFEMAKGELIVVAAGDDISVPERTEKIVQAWLEAGKPTCVIHSEAFTFSDDDIHTAHRNKNRLSNISLNFEEAICKYNIQPIIMGCSAAYTPDLYHFFGALDFAGMIEDIPLSYRALLLGTRIFIQEPLLFYRRPSDDSRSICQKNINTVEFARFVVFKFIYLQQISRDYILYCKKNNILPQKIILKKILKRQLAFCRHINYPTSNILDLVIRFFTHPDIEPFEKKIVYFLSQIISRYTTLHQLLRFTYRLYAGYKK